MSRKIRYIKPLIASEIEELESGLKSDIGYQFQQRCHAILLSNQGYAPSEIKDIFDVTVHTVYTWYNRWESGGLDGLKNASGQGRKPALSIDNSEHVKVVEKAVKKVNERGGNLLAAIESELDLEEGLTMRIVRSFLKKMTTSGNDAEEL